MSVVINSKIGENRSLPRVWAEGMKLARLGYKPEQTFTAKVIDDGVLIKLSDSGDRKISRRTRMGCVMPLIEVRAEFLLDVFKVGDPIRIAVKRNSIKITRHHLQKAADSRLTRFMNRLKSNKPLRMGSLFQGGAILDSAIHAGFEREGVASYVKTVVELEGKYLESSLKNNPQLWQDDSVIIESPIQWVDMTRKAVDLEGLVVGLPCTGASKEGITRNQLEFAEAHKDAGALFYWFLNFVQVSQPAFIVIENVENYMKTASMAVIRSVLNTLGYSLQERILDGEEMGALERRKRMCAVAVTHGLEDCFDLDSIEPIRTKEETLSAVLEDIPLDSDMWKPFEGLVAKEKRDKAAGKGFKMIKTYPADTFVHVIKRGYAKVRSNEVYIPHPSIEGLYRMLTVKEHAAVKTVPPHLIEGNSVTVGHEILGQGVIYCAFEAVGKALAKAFKQLTICSENEALAA